MKIQSPSTPGIYHDESNLLVEFLMINKYGVLEEYSWRKDKPLAKEWGSVLKIVRRLLKTFKITPNCLAWYIKYNNISHINYSEFGLVRWKVNKLFPKLDLAKLAEEYKVNLIRELDNIRKNQKLNDVIYCVKSSNSSSGKKTLLQVLEELENDARF